MAMRREFVSLHDESAKKKGPKEVASKCVDPFTSCRRFWESVLGFFPIVSWLPKYSVRENLLFDLIGGVTIAILLIPIGIAFAALADVNPIYGLYASFFPFVAYFFVGSSPFLSVGPSSLLALMLGVSKNRILSDEAFSEYSSPRVVSTMTFTMSLIMMVTAALRIDFLVAFVSDQLVDGYVFAACAHIFVSQMKDILGYSIPDPKGFGSIFIRSYRILFNISQTSLLTFGIFLFSLAFLFIGKDYGTPPGIPVPYEVFIMIGMTGVSSFFNLNSAYNVSVIGDIPSGLPYPSLPVFPLISECVSDCIGMAIVGISFQLSMARVSANRVRTIQPDYAQEVYAIGICNMVGSFFGTVPTAAGLGRTVILIGAGARTPLSSLFVAALILLVILWLGPLFEQLPMSVLAAVVAISMRPLFVKIRNLPGLWKSSKIDFAIWSFSCGVTMLTDIMTGFGASFAFAIFTVVLRNQWPSHQSAILFSNCAKFRKNFTKTVDLWDTASKSEFHFVFDFRAVTAIDTMGIGTLREVISEVRERGNVDVYFLGTNDTVIDALYRAEFFRIVPKEFFVDDFDDLEVAIEFRKSMMLKHEFVPLLDESETRRTPKEIALRSLRPFTSRKRFCESLLGFFPIVSWLPKYCVRENLLFDVSSGLTVGMFLIPQGIAFAALAGLPPVFGLYTAFFPMLLFLFFGTFPSLSVGPSALLALMVRVSKDRILADPSHSHLEDIALVRTLTFYHSLVQILMAAFHLDFLVAFVSDQLVDGYIVAASAHIFISQMDDVLGYRVTDQKGFGRIFITLYRTLVNIQHVNFFTFGVSLLSGTILYLGKEYGSPKKFPIPYEMILMVSMSALSSFFSFNDSFSAEVIGEIPSGLPYPVWPEFGLLGTCASDAVGLAIVGVANHLSMGKVFARKTKGSGIDYCQEIYALGITNLLCGMFSCMPASTGLGRSLLAVSSGIKSFVSNVISALFILVTIIWLGPYFEKLPSCILATIVIISIHKMFLKVRVVPQVLATSKMDFLIWLFSFVSTLLTDVMTGFSLSFAFAIFTLGIRNQWPSWVAQNSKDNRICVFSHHAAILFSNCAKFKKTFTETFDFWDTKASLLSRVFVFDFRTVSAIDVMGTDTLGEIISDVRERGNVDIYFLGANDTVIGAFYRAEFFQIVPKEFFVNDFDDLEIAIGRRAETKQNLKMLKISVI